MCCKGVKEKKLTSINFYVGVMYSRGNSTTHRHFSLQGVKDLIYCCCCGCFVVVVFVVVVAGVVGHFVIE